MKEEIIKCTKCGNQIKEDKDGITTFHHNDKGKEICCDCWKTLNKKDNDFICQFSQYRGSRICDNDNRKCVIYETDVWCEGEKENRQTCPHWRNKE